MASNDNKEMTSYSDAIREGFQYLFRNHNDVFAIGQGLWSPWYVGNTMLELEKEFGKERLLDTPVSESACTGAAIGASLCGYRPIVVHPRMDFMLLAIDQIVNQAAKWSHMLGGQAHPKLTVRGIINRGGEQGAQHSQALHSFFAHIPGLRVVMPATVEDARDLLISSVLCDDPVIYIDDRWLYENEATLPEPTHIELDKQGPRVIKEGEHVTLVGSGYATDLCIQAAESHKGCKCSVEVVDLRIISPIDYSVITRSVEKTGKLIVVDSGWANCGLSAEIIAGVTERLPGANLVCKRITLPASPAPTSKPLEALYYPTVATINKTIREIM